MPLKDSREPADVFQHRAQRKNIPPAGLESHGVLKKEPRYRHDYNPHLPPVLRSSPRPGDTDRLPTLLRMARKRPLTADEAELLADALRRHEPWLDWSGKRERPWFEVDPVPLHIHERVSTQAILRTVRRRDANRSLFGDPDLDYTKAVQFYQHDVDWTNRMILGDSLQVMSSLARRESLAGKVQMIYMDPPYGINFKSNFQPDLGKRDVKDTAEDLTREPEMVRAYRDTWTLGVHSYLTYLRDRLAMAKELLHPTGSIFVQIGDENVHRVRAILDELFGSQNFMSVISFRTKIPLNAAYLPNIADYIVWFARDKTRVKHHRLFRTRSSGKGSQHIDLMATGYTPSCHFSFRLNGRWATPNQTNSWKTTPNGMRRLVRSERLLWLKTVPRYIFRSDDYPVFQLTNQWSDTQGAIGKMFAVQTAMKVIERCVLMTTDPGDVVLDPTCGSGTTGHVAEQYGRRWILIDTSRVALTLAKHRLLTARFDYYRLRRPSASDLERNPTGPWLRAETGGGGGRRWPAILSLTSRSVASRGMLRWIRSSESTTGSCIA